MNATIDALTYLAGLAWAGASVCALIVAWVSDEPVRVGFDVSGKDTK